MEEEQWLSAAIHVLVEAQRPLHYTNIKQLIADKRLVSAGYVIYFHYYFNCRSSESNHAKLCFFC